MSEFRAALDLDHRYCTLCAERAKPGRGKPVLIMRIGFFTCFHAISLETQSFQQNRHVIFPFSEACSTGLPRPRLARLPVCCPVHCGSQLPARLQIIYMYAHFIMLAMLLYHSCKYLHDSHSHPEEMIYQLGVLCTGKRSLHFCTQ